jgi:hypothetical protein
MASRFTFKGTVVASGITSITTVAVEKARIRTGTLSQG